MNMSLARGGVASTSSRCSSAAVDRGIVALRPRGASAFASQHLLNVSAKKTAYGCSRRTTCKAQGTTSSSSTASVSTASSSSATPVTGRDVILRYYEAYNAGDIDTIASLLAPDVEYHDMIYEEPFRGREEVVQFLKKVKRIAPSDMKFVIEDVTGGDTRAVGITWHAEIGEGTVFPFSRGCSFYTLNEQGQIIKARDLVEGSVKPGASALKALTVLAPLVRKLGPDADPATLKRLPLAAAAVWAFYAAYSAYIMLGTSAPGAPVWATPPEVFAEVLHESLNFFYVNIGLAAVGLSPVPSIAENPISEALFNFVCAWSLMALPYMLADGPSRKLGPKALTAWWAGIMFLTNVFYIPYLAFRAAPEPLPEQQQGQQQQGARALPPPPPPNAPLPGWAPAFGGTALAVGLFSLGWAAVARPEYGDLADRVSYAVQQFNTNRVFYAFVVDSGLYCVWQAVLMRDAPDRYRLVPFFGMALHLLSGGRSREQEEEEAQRAKGSV